MGGISSLFNKIKPSPTASIGLLLLIVAFISVFGAWINWWTDPYAIAGLLAVAVGSLVFAIIRPINGKAVAYLCLAVAFSAGVFVWTSLHHDTNQASIGEQSFIELVIPHLTSASSATNLEMTPQNLAPLPFLPSTLNPPNQKYALAITPDPIDTVAYLIVSPIIDQAMHCPKLKSVNTPPDDVHLIAKNGKIFEISAEGLGDCTLKDSLLFTTSGSKTYFHTPQLIIETNSPKALNGSNKTSPAPHLCVTVQGPAVPFSNTVIAFNPPPTSSSLAFGLSQWTQCTVTDLTQTLPSKPTQPLPNNPERYLTSNAPISVTFGDDARQEHLDSVTLLLGALLGVAGGFAAMSLDAWLESKSQA
jgi:hypothetical protein